MDLLGKIQDRSAVVSVVGLGYAGLPLAVAFAEAGFRVLGVDIDGERVARLNRGDPAVQDVSPQRLKALEPLHPFSLQACLGPRWRRFQIASKAAHPAA